MNYRKLGKSGLKVSDLSYGSWVTFGNQIDTKLAKELTAPMIPKNTIIEPDIKKLFFNIYD